MLQTSPPKLQRIYRRTLDRYAFRIATEADVDGMVALWPEHWAEAHYTDRGIEPDETRYRAWMTDMLHYGLGVWIVALDGDEIVGFFAYTLDHNFCVRPVAVMGTFFVSRKHRRSAVPAILFELGVSQAAADGACAFHAPITSETQSSRALENSFKKAGFTVIGTMMGKAL
jgi:L-amino acid N-acyltransferase YncA